MADDPATPVDLSGGRLSAIASAWKRQRRVIVASFDGTSMLPTLSRESSLEIHCGALPEPGEIVAYESHDQLIIHRVVARSRGYLISRGDASWIPDRPIRVEDVLGTVRGARSGNEPIDIGSKPPRVPVAILDRAAGAFLTLHFRLADALIRLARSVRWLVLRSRGRKIN